LKKALIIGAAGFVGGYLIRELADTFEVHATKLPEESINNSQAIAHDLDILKKEDIVTLLYEIRPDAIFHLAAQSSVGVAWRNPGLTVDINIKGSINVMDAVRELFYKPRILLIGSGEEYGHIRPQDTPIQEETILRPGNIYAATKACQNMIGSIYAKAYDMQVMMVRAFNHIGPAQAPIFVVSDFCHQVAEIEKGLKEPVMMVGNLEAKRDFTDVRDVVKAYRLLMEHGEPGETYNVGSGQARSIRDVLDLIIANATTQIQVQIDPAKIRPVDVAIIEADITKLQLLTGWSPTIALEQTIRETLDYWRDQLHTV
jgi:GDP-4-dehydro-6-deoxy-D-mannose reductase